MLICHRDLQLRGNLIASVLILAEKNRDIRDDTGNRNIEVGGCMGVNRSTVVHFNWVCRGEYGV